MHRATIQCARNNIRRLFATPRAWAAVIVTILFLMNQFAPIKQMLVEEGLRLSWPGMMTYLLSDAFVSMMLGFMALLVLFDAPMTDETQKYLITRTGRGAWARGQVLYVWLTVIGFLALTALIQLALQLQWTDWSAGWSGAMNALVNEGAYEYYNTMLDYDVWLMRVYGPVSGCLTVMGLHGLAYGVLALVMFVGNTLGAGKAAFLVAGAPLVFDALVEEFFSEAVLKFSPVSLARLTTLDYGDEMGRPPMVYAVAVLLILAAGLTVLAVAVARRKEVTL